MNKFIDPKNPNTVGKSAWNLGNHVLITMLSWHWYSWYMCRINRNMN